MKYQLEIDDIERDMLITALTLWEFRLGGIEGKAPEPEPGHAHWYAARFTLKVITDMKARLAKLSSDAVQ